MLRLVIVSDTEIMCGPLTWVRDDEPREGSRPGAEVWRVKRPHPELKLTGFCVKNYGGGCVNPDNAFSGWRLVSGGPFTQAGQWGTRAAAIRQSTPFVVAYYQRQAIERRDEAVKILAAYQMSTEDMVLMPEDEAKTA